MPAVQAKAAHDLADFTSFLRQLDEEGFQFTVIGGCAVTAYAKMIDVELYSVDLDIYVTQETLRDLLDWAPRQGIRVVKRPRPRHLPVAFFEVDGKEVNALTSTRGLPAPDVVARVARPFLLAEGLEVPLADPFDLLRNKLEVLRDKDRPHIEILRRFVEIEALAAFSEETKPRARLAPSRRLLEVLRTDVLPEGLAGRLVEAAEQGADFRFLMSRVPTPEQAERLMARVARRETELQRQLEEIRAHRRFAEIVAS